MRAITKLNVGIRTQALAVISVVAIWYWSLWLGLHAGKGFVSNLSLFWNAVFTLFPFIAPVLTAILLISYFRSGRPHRWWVRLAVLATLTPWLLFLMYLFEAGFL